MRADYAIAMEWGIPKEINRHGALGWLFCLPWITAVKE